MMGSNSHLHSMSLFGLLAAFLKTGLGAEQRLDYDSPHLGDIC